MKHLEARQVIIWSTWKQGRTGAPGSKGRGQKGRDGVGADRCNAEVEGFPLCLQYPMEQGFELGVLGHGSPQETDPVGHLETLLDGGQKAGLQGCRSEGQGQIAGHAKPAHAACCLKKMPEIAGSRSRFRSRDLRLTM